MPPKKQPSAAKRAARAKPAPLPRGGDDAAAPIVHTPHGVSFVLVSDLHAHPWAAFATGDGSQNSRLRRSIALLDRTLSVAQECSVPWVFAGDLVHTAGYSLNVVLAELTTTLLRYPDVPKLAVWGNHDARGIGGRITLEQTVFGPLAATVPNLYILDPSVRAEPVSAGGLTFSGAGYQPRESFLTLGAEADVGIYHQTVRGTRTPTGLALEEGIAAGSLLAKHRVAAVGHVHHAQFFDGLTADRALIIPGSPEQHNFGDLGDHGWWLIKVPPAGTPLRPANESGFAEFVPGGSPKFLTVDTPADVRDDSHFYRVRRAVRGQELPSGATAIAPTPQVVETRDRLRGATGQQVLETWLDIMPPEADLPRERFLAAGRELLAEQASGWVRPLRLVRLTLRNFCSYEEETFDVRPGVQLVLGRGYDFPSNGAGKSTLFESLFWVLFGRTTKGLTGDEVIRWGAKECVVEAEFVSARPGSDEWVRVSRSRGKRAELIVDTSDGRLEGKSVNELTDALIRYIGVTPELYQALAYFSQERLLLFAAATDGERKTMLADLVGLSAYQEASSAAMHVCQDVERQITLTEALRDAALAQVVLEDAQLARETGAAAAWQTAHNQRVSAAQEALAQLDGNAAARRAKAVDDERLVREQKYTQECARLEAALTAIQDQLDAAPVVDAAVLTRAEKQFTIVSNALAQFRGQLAAAEQQHKNVRTRLAQQERQLAEGVCPSCQQPITPDHRDACLRDVRAEEAASATAVAETSAQITRAATRMEQVTAVVVPLRAQAVAAQAAAQRGLEMDDLRGQLMRVMDREAAATEQAGEIFDKQYALQREVLSTGLAHTEAETNPHDGTAALIVTRIQDAKARVETHAAARRAQQEQVAVYDYWRIGFSRQGVQSLLLDEIAVAFNDERGTIFPTLTQGIYDVQFSTVSMTKGGESRERTEFLVFARGEPVPYASLSGGQRRRIDVGVMLTLLKATSRWLQVPGLLGVLVLDEVFGFLDASGAEGLVAALREVQDVISSVYVVSHDLQLQALLPETIVVEQNAAGLSTILA